MTNLSKKHVFNADVNKHCGEFFLYNCLVKIVHKKTNERKNANDHNKL